MVIFGLTMQGQKQEVPKVIADWLFERVKQYPNIDFEINKRENIAVEQGEREAVEQMVRKFSRVYSMFGNTNGILHVIFPYLNENWTIKIIGGLDDEGKMVNRADPEYVQKVKQPLPAELRNEIAGVQNISELESLPNGTVAQLRAENELVLDKPKEFIPFIPELFYTSEVTMSGAQFKELLSNAEIKDQVISSIKDKDWEALNKLKVGR
ncbi:MAG: hypothetical protein ABH846_04325 [Patescibacteria group bacterium]